MALFRVEDWMSVFRVAANALHKQSYHRPSQAELFRMGSLRIIFAARFLGKSDLLSPTDQDKQKKASTHVGEAFLNE